MINLTNNTHFKHLNHYKLPKYLVFGFMSIIFLIIVIAIVGISKSQVLRSELELVVNHYNQNIKLVRLMRVAARERITMLHSASNTRDEFARDEYIQQFWDYGEEFLIARETLLTLKLSDEEKKFIEKHRSMARDFAPPQREVIAMLEKGLTNEARHYLVNFVEPNQSKVLKVLDEYLNRLHELADNTLVSVRNASEQNILLLSLLAIVGTIISVFIAILVSTKLRNLLTSETNAKKIAENANQIKSDFMANISHELRTPMNAILGYNQLILSSGLTQEQQIQQQKLAKASTDLHRIINGLLDFTQLDSNNLKLEQIDFNFLDLIQSVSTELKPQAIKKGLDFNLNIDQSIPAFFHSDQEKIKQILFNLLENAIKFTNKGHISLSVNLEKSLENNFFLVKFMLTDTGLGISDEQALNLFQVFSQADSSSTRQQNGLGMGLILSKKLIALFEGELKLNSKLAEGSTFEFCLSLQKSNDVATLLNQSLEDDIAIEVEDNILINETSDVEFNQEQVNEKIVRLQALIKDDDTEATELVNELLPYYQGREEYTVLVTISELLNDYEFEQALSLLQTVKLNK